MRPPLEVPGRVFLSLLVRSPGGGGFPFGIVGTVSSSVGVVRIRLRDGGTVSLEPISFGPSVGIYYYFASSMDRIVYFEAVERSGVRERLYPPFEPPQYWEDEEAERGSGKARVLP